MKYRGGSPSTKNDCEKRQGCYFVRNDRRTQKQPLFFSILNRLLFLIIQYLWKIDNKNYQMSFFSETLYLVTFYAKKCVPIQSLRMLLKFNQSRFTDKFYLKF